MWVMEECHNVCKDRCQNEVKGGFQNVVKRVQCQNMVYQWSPVKRILGVCKKTPRKKTRILWPQFPQNTELFLECVFILRQSIPYTSEFLQITYYYPLLLFN